MNRTFFILPFLFIACSHGFYQPSNIEYNDYRIRNDEAKDSQMIFLLKPFADSVNSTMNIPIGKLESPLEKKLPEGTLGNFMADAYLAEARLQYKMPVDIAFMNDGGIRIGNIAAGNITNGKIFELMPFDNLLVLLKLKGSQLQQLLDQMAGKGGEPIAGGSYIIKEKKASGVMVGNNSIDTNIIYTIAISDYMANGGSDYTMLKGMPQISKGYLQRDALIDYVRNIDSKGEAIKTPSIGRIRKEDK